jgi:hypothetical protein
MNEKEMRELDCWLAINVMGNSIHNAASAKGEQWYWSAVNNCVMDSYAHSFKPTDDPAAAMQVLEKCCNKTTLAINHGTTGWWVSDCDKKSRFAVAETLPLAICLLARKVFAK